MFQSYGYKHIGCDEDKTKVNNAITIIDDDFIEIVIISPATFLWADEATALIKIYSHRNLNVAKNLWLLLEHLHKWKRIGRTDIIEWWQKYVPTYAPYHDDLLYYLTFT